MLSSSEKDFIAAVNERRLIQTCSDLVRIPTVNPHGSGLASDGEIGGQVYIEDAFRDLGASVERLDCIPEVLTKDGILAPEDRTIEGRPNIIGRFRAGTGDGPVILLDAHMDTVPVDEYHCDPFSGQVADGFIHGRGSSDDKGGIAVMLEAVRASLSIQDPSVSGTIICCSVVEEECDGSGRGSLSCIKHLSRPDAAIVIDGSFGRIWNGSTGIITAEITTGAPGGHAAANTGANAIEKAAALLPAFDIFRDKRGRRPGCCNLGVFRAGNHASVIPVKARLVVNLKTWIEDMLDSEKAYGERSGRIVRELFESCVLETAARIPEFADDPPGIRWIKDLPAASCDGDSADLIEKVSGAHSDITGIMPPVEPLHGWGDISHFVRAGVPCVGLGAGHPGAAHSTREKVAVASLTATARILMLTIYRILKQSGQSI